MALSGPIGNGNGVVGAPLTRSRTRRPVTQSGSISLAVQGLATLPDNDVVWAVIPVTGETVSHPGRDLPISQSGRELPIPALPWTGAIHSRPCPPWTLHAAMTQPDCILSGGKGRTLPIPSDTQPVTCTLLHSKAYRLG